MTGSDKSQTNDDNANLIALVFAQQKTNPVTSSTKGKITDFFQNKRGHKRKFVNKKGKKKKHTVTKRSSINEKNLENNNNEDNYIIAELAVMYVSSSSSSDKADPSSDSDPEEMSPHKRNQTTNTLTYQIWLIGLHQSTFQLWWKQ